MTLKLRQAFLFLLVLLLFTSSLFAAQTGSLYAKFQGKTVKTFVTEVKDATKDREINPKLLKEKIEEALRNRKSIRFEVVQNAADADISIDTEVNEFMWTDHDPIDMLMGVGGTAMDAAQIEDYARLQADMTVTDHRSKKVLWKERVTATVTKKPMPRAESIPLISEDLAKVFMKECFSKKRAK